LRSVIVLVAQWMKVLSDLAHVIIGCHLGLVHAGLSAFDHWACLWPRVGTPLHVQWWGSALLVCDQGVE